MERFKEISHAASILTNPKQKQLYDEFITTNRYHNNNTTTFHRTSTSQQQQFFRNGGSNFRPRNFILAPMALYLSIITFTYIFGIDMKDIHPKNYQQQQQQQLDQNASGSFVLAWKNPKSGNYETPAPWDPIYQQVQPKLVHVPRNQIRSPQQ